MSKIGQWPDLGSRWQDQPETDELGNVRTPGDRWVTWGGEITFTGHGGSPLSPLQELCRCEAPSPRVLLVLVDVATTADVRVIVDGGVGRASLRTDQLVTTGPTQLQFQQPGRILRVLVRHESGAVVPSFTVSGVIAPYVSWLD